MQGDGGNEHRPRHVRPVGAAGEGSGQEVGLLPLRSRRRRYRRSRLLREELPELLRRGHPRARLRNVRSQGHRVGEAVPRPRVREDQGALHGVHVALCADRGGLERHRALPRAVGRPVRQQQAHGIPERPVVPEGQHRGVQGSHDAPVFQHGQARRARWQPRPRHRIPDPRGLGRYRKRRPRRPEAAGASEARAGSARRLDARPRVPRRDERDKRRRAGASTAARGTTRCRASSTTRTTRRRRR